MAIAAMACNLWSPPAMVFTRLAPASFFVDCVVGFVETGKKNKTSATFAVFGPLCLCPLCECMTYYCLCVCARTHTKVLLLIYVYECGGAQYAPVQERWTFAHCKRATHRKAHFFWLTGLLIPIMACSLF